MSFENKHHRRSIRLKDYDYSSAGAYFVTICAHNRDCLFGEIIDGEMVLNDAGKMVERCWLEIPDHYPSVELDEFVIMPNHIHGIIVIPDFVGVQDFEPLQQTIKSDKSDILKKNRFQHIIPRSIGAIIRGFKIGVTKWFRNNTNIVFVFQRNFYEHIIRDESDLNRIREYIVNNPARWQDDEENPSF